MKRDVSSLQVLIATMHQTDSELLQRMNIQSDAIVGNQCGHNSVEYIDYCGKHIRWINDDSRGVGLNRNMAWMHATADIILFADDDMVYVDGYKEEVLRLFNQNPKADIIIFNTERIHKSQLQIKKTKFVRNLGYATPRISVRRDVLHKKGINFNLCFGGGALYSCGEDTLFLADCLSKGLKVLAVPYTIAKITNNRESTWFHGYTQKFYFDKGVLLAATKVQLPYLRAFKNVLLDRTQQELTPITRIKAMFNGIKYYRQL